MVSDTTVTNHNSSSYFSFDFNIQIGDIKVVIADHSSNVGDQNGDHVNPVIHVQDEPNEQKVVTDTRDVDWDKMATMVANSTTMVGGVPVTVSDPARVKFMTPNSTGMSRLMWVMRRGDALTVYTTVSRCATRGARSTPPRRRRRSGLRRWPSGR
jgi:hypothetical protein